MALWNTNIALELSIFKIIFFLTTTTTTSNSLLTFQYQQQLYAQFQPEALYIIDSREETSECQCECQLEHLHTSTTSS